MALEFSSDQAEHHWLFRGVCNSDCALMYLGFSIKHRICIFLKIIFCLPFLFVGLVLVFLFLVICPITKNLRFLKKEILKPLPLV